MSKIAALETKFKQIEQQLQAARREVAGPIIERIKNQMKAHGITAADLTDKATELKAAAKGIGKSVATKAQAVKTAASKQVAVAKNSVPAKAAKIKAAVSEQLTPAKALAKNSPVKVAAKANKKVTAKKTPVKAAESTPAA